jgi:hypothetical protein
MTITAPVYQIHCDEPGCGRVHTFLLSSTDWPGVYEMPSANEVYAHFGGETLDDGKHRCAQCRAKSDHPPDAPKPQEITERMLRITAARSRVTSAAVVITRAQAYRATEQDGTPRLWRGKHLNDLGIALDEALEQFDQ